MKKLTMITMLMVVMLSSLPVQAGHRYDGKYEKQWSKHHHVYKPDHPGRGHKHRARKIHHGEHAHPHHRRHAHDHSHPVAHHDDGGHWGIVFRYFQ